MNANVKIDIDPDKILAQRGLGSSNATTRLLAETVARLSDPYVPMAPASGHMKSQLTIAPDGSAITYHGPYAHYQYVGDVMVGVETGSAYAKSGEPKRYTGRPIQYSGAPRRGKAWEKRMLADRLDEIRKAIANRVGGRPK